jgi:hypothetical protein
VPRRPGRAADGCGSAGGAATRSVGHPTVREPTAPRRPKVGEVEAQPTALGDREGGHRLRTRLRTRPPRCRWGPRPTGRGCRRFPGTPGGSGIPVWKEATRTRGGDIPEHPVAVADRRGGPGVMVMRAVVARGWRPGRRSRSTTLLTGLMAAAVLSCLRPSRPPRPVSVVPGSVGPGVSSYCARAAGASRPEGPRAVPVSAAGAGTRDSVTEPAATSAASSKDPGPPPLSRSS